MFTRTRRHTLLAAASATLAAVAPLLAPAAPAAAHNSLRASEPAASARLPTPPARISLTFQQELDPTFTTIVLSDAGRRRIPTGVPAVTGATGTATIDQPLPDGTYTVAYRVVSADGHPVQGSYAFTVGDPPAGDVAAGPVGSTTVAPAAASRDDGGTGPWPVAAGGLLLALAAGSVVLLRRRRATT
ncbi:copper resistance protein CopC [Micromonospora krabiensis]|uniref:CopC domain-containing protein n=1 Tax=Micromonospora krabiensis TaxID=307121 RepID=A0A1C3N0H7_9ACTN|nr:copper resistance CopC family protein [Micromonospora krabiensis]SBV26061.1 hypothetical protein GA0070620_1543 [Micromonospora krabiensis]